MGYVFLDRPVEWPPLTGIVQHSQETGRRAIDLLDVLLKNHELGCPPRRQILTLEGSWNVGTTVRTTARP